jgi:hypothetical protein
MNWEGVSPQASDDSLSGSSQWGVAPFSPGSVVLVTLNQPREKFWGAVMAVSTAGIAMRGVDLNSFEDFVRQVKIGEQVAAHAVFFPMHRVERMELDSRNGDIPSMQERFESKSGTTFRKMFVTG